MLLVQAKYLCKCHKRCEGNATELCVKVDALSRILMATRWRSWLGWDVGRRGSDVIFSEIVSPNKLNLIVQENPQNRIRDGKV